MNVFIGYILDGINFIVSDYKIELIQLLFKD